MRIRLPQEIDPYGGLHKIHSLDRLGQHHWLHQQLQEVGPSYLCFKGPPGDSDACLNLESACLTCQKLTKKKKGKHTWPQRYPFWRDQFQKRPSLWEYVTRPVGGGKKKSLRNGPSMGHGITQYGKGMIFLQTSIGTQNQSTQAQSFFFTLKFKRWQHSSLKILWP